MTKRRLPLAPAAIFCTLLWGSAAPFIKWGYELLQIESTGDILVFAGLRFMLAGLLVLLTAHFFEHKKLISAHIRPSSIATLALFQTFAQYWFYYVGVSNTFGVTSAVITGTGAFISLLMSVYIFQYESMTANKALGCFLGFAGIVVMNLSGMDGFHFAWVGEGMILASQLSSALSSAFIKKFTQTQDAVLLSGWQFLAGGTALCLAGFVMGGFLPAPVLSGWLVLLYLAFVSGGCLYRMGTIAAGVSFECGGHIQLSHSGGGRIVECFAAGGKCPGIFMEYAGGHGTGGLRRVVRKQKGCQMTAFMILWAVRLGCF